MGKVAASVKKNDSGGRERKSGHDLTVNIFRI